MNIEWDDSEVKEDSPLSDLHKFIYNLFALVNEKEEWTIDEMHFENLVWFTDCK